MLSERSGVGCPLASVDRRQLFLPISSLIMCPDGPVSILVINFVVHVCATAHLPIVVLVGACGPALSEMVVSTENLPFYGLREVVLGLVRSTSRVQTYVARKRRFSGMIPSQSLKGRFRGLCSFSFRTHMVQLAYPSPVEGVVR